MKRNFTFTRISLALLAALLLSASLLPAFAVPARAETAAPAEENAGKKPTSVKLDRSTATMLVGQKLQLTATVQPSTAETKLTWKTSNASVAKVSKKGEVKAVGVGTAKITVSTSNRKRASIKVTVKRLDISQLDSSRYRYFRRFMSDSELRKAYEIALKKVVTPLYGLNKMDQLRGVASTLCRMSSDVGYSMKIKHYNDPYGFLVLKVASCAGYTRTVGLCLNMLGISYEHANENQYTHQWARVKVGNETWAVDAMLGGIWRES